eukprot:2658258-Prymnesium_polylepis.1
MANTSCGIVKTAATNKIKTKTPAQTGDFGSLPMQVAQRTPMLKRVLKRANPTTCSTSSLILDS